MSSARTRARTRPPSPTAIQAWSQARSNAGARPSQSADRIRPPAGLSTGGVRSRRHVRVGERGRIALSAESPTRGEMAPAAGSVGAAQPGGGHRGLGPAHVLRRLRGRPGGRPHVFRGEIFTFLGPNGAGKTTTVEILEGHRKRTAGEVRVLGEDPEHADRRWRAQVGVVLQSSRVEQQLTSASASSSTPGTTRRRDRFRR